jgi:hypothetical protein
VSGIGLGDRDAPLRNGIRADEGKSLTGRWLNSQDLREGDKLHSREGSEIEVTAIERRIVRNQPVCNLTVEGYHNFSVTAADLLAHNESWCDILIKKGWSSQQKEFLLDLATSNGIVKSAVHGHHIVMRNGGGDAGDAARAILKEYGIPLLDEKPALKAATDLSNMAMAIGNHYLGIHGDEYAKKVLDRLSDAVAEGGSHEQIKQRIQGALGDMRAVLEKGEKVW